MGINNKKFELCLKDPAMKKEIQGDIADGKSAGVRGTPAFLINGKLLSGARPFSSFKNAIDSELN